MSSASEISQDFSGKVLKILHSPNISIILTAELFRVYEPLFGANCIQYANGSDGRARRAAYDKSFSQDVIKMYFPKLQTIADGLASKWASMVKEEHIPLGQYMFAFAVKSTLTALLGDYFETDKEVLAFKTHYDLTPVIHALGVSLQDEKTWPLPNKFDPERFTPEHSKDRPPLAFSPFGFAGKRQCPAHKFAYQEASVCLATLIKK